MSMKVVLDGRSYTNSAFLELLETVFDALREIKTASDLARYQAIRDYLNSPQGESLTKALELSADSCACMDSLVTHASAPVGAQLPDSLTITGSGSKPMVAIEAGPVTIEIGVADLQRAIRAFES